MAEVAVSRMKKEKLKGQFKPWFADKSQREVDVTDFHLFKQFFFFLLSSYRTYKVWRERVSYPIIKRAVQMKRNVNTTHGLQS